MSNNTIEVKTKKICKQLLCQTCNGQTVDDTSSEFSRKVKQEVKGLVISGKTEQEIITILRHEYGEQITLYKPFDSYLTIIISLLVILLIIWRKFYKSSSQ